MKMNIEGLFRQYNKIWIRIPQDARADFAAEMNRLNACLANGEMLTEETCGQYMALTEDRKLSYVSAMAWALSHEPGNGQTGVYHSFGNIPKITYADHLRESVYLE